MNNDAKFGESLRFSGVALAILLSLMTSAWAQQPSSYYERKTAIEQSKSRAESEADQLVSLSAENIVAILRREPGLLLEVKKSIVRHAFDQGRVLAASELSDSALFRLIEEDDGVRILATREIQDRQYVKAKPSQDEIARNLPCRQPLPNTTETPAPEPSSVIDTRRIPSQEETYWHKHDDDVDCDTLRRSELATFSQNPSFLSQNQYGQQQYPYLQNPMGQYSGGQSTPPANAPNQPPQQPSPLGPSWNDTRRQLQFTQMQNQPESDFDAAQSSNDTILGQSPAENPGLLSTSSNGLPMPDLAGSSGTSALAGAMPWSTAMSPNSPFDTFGQPNPTGSNYSTSNNSNIYSRYWPLYKRPAQPEQPALRHRPNPYADVPSLYDLYAQYQKRSPKLERFGEDVFRNGTGNFNELPMDLPVGPEYVVGPGDGLSIQLSGAISRRLQVLVDREGRVPLPEVGAVQVAGKNMSDVQRLVQTSLRQQFHAIDADVSLGRIRSVRVYVVGDVERAGAYDVSSLSTPLNALYVAGGPTSNGSLRILRHYRGKHLLQEVDVYSLLLNGVNNSLEHLEDGDTVQVPPLGAEITIEGMVRRPAIYELDGEKSLADVLDLAGGVMSSGTLRHVDVERVEAHETRTMLRLDIPENNNEATVNEALANFKIQDGDKIKITPILPFPDKTVYLDGHVSRPGKFAYREGMRVTDLISSYTDLLPEPYKAHAEIIRLQPPDYAPEILAFNLEEAMNKTDQDIVLKPFDTVRVFGRFDFEDQPVVTVTGEVRDPGDHITNGATYLRDAIYLAGGVTAGASTEDVQVFRKTPDAKIQVVSVNLGKALAGDSAQNLLLEPKDRVFVHKNLARTDPAIVTVEGEIARPGKYPLGQDMTAATLVRLAGGFKRGAFTQEADLTRYDVEQGTRVVSDHVSIPIGQAVDNVADVDVRLRDGDVLTIRQITGWKDLGATIKVTGEVAHPGTYGIQEGERLSSIIQRAGGFRTDAYPYGAVFERDQIRDMEEKNRADLLSRVQNEAAGVKSIPEQNQEDILAKQAAVEQYQSTLLKLQNAPPQGRMVIHISTDVTKWMNTSSDVQVRAGDTIHIPKKPGVVLVDGSVYNPTGITYKPGKSAGWYLKQAGGPNETANKKGVFVIRADGSVVGGTGGLLSGGAENAEMHPGDMVVVPEKVFTVSRAWQNTAIAAQIVTAIAISASYAKSF
jgi:protein involved in polysaccharide export with SLBB domain